MEVQLVQFSSIPQGLVASSFIYEPGQSIEGNASNDVLVSVCSTGRLMAFISSFKAQFVACEESVSLKEKILPKYVNSYEGLLHVVRDPAQSRPSATACVIVPVTIELRPEVSQTSSVIVVGFSDGYIRGYSKTGKSVFSQLLHPEPVVKLKVMCHAPSYNQTPYTQSSSLVVLLKGKVVCIVDGLSLTEVIKHNITRRNQDEFDLSESDRGVPLSYKKFNLQDHSGISDVALISQSTASAYDYLREASIVGGWDMVIRSGPVPEAKLITVGEQPMVALYRISKDAGTLNMTEVVHAVASRMTNAVLGRLSAAGGWLNWGGGSGGGGGAKSSTTQTPSKGKSLEEKQQPMMNLPMSTNIPDPRRHVTSIVVSPVGNLASMVDEFGRVMLVDLGCLVIRRMWKGYRDAQCGWLVVSDPSELSRRAQCLCVYAPRRGILEFWPVQTGPRVAAFQVGKGCRLLHITHSMFGKEGLLRELSSASNQGLHDRAVLLCADGRMLTFSVPFPSLMQRSSPQSHDSHMLLKLDQAIVTGDQNLINEITHSVKSSQALREIVQVMVDSFEASSRTITKDSVMKVLNIAVIKTRSLKDFTVPEEVHCHYVMIRQLCQFYFSILDLLSADPSSNITTELQNTLSQFFQDQCGLSFLPAEKMEKLLSSYCKSHEPLKRVRECLKLKDLINCFETFDNPVDCLLPQAKQLEGVGLGAEEVKMVSLKENLQDSVLANLGEFLFKNILSQSTLHPDAESLFKESGVSPFDLFMLLVSFWVSGSIGLLNPALQANVLSDLARILLSLSSAGNVSFWSDIQRVIASSHFPGHSLLVAVLCEYLSSPNNSARTVAIERIRSLKSTEQDQKRERQEDREQDEDEEGEEEWETITFEREQWARLCGVLELLTQLSLLTGSRGLGTIPPVLFMRCLDEEGAEEAIDIRKIKIQMLFGETERRGVCVSVLESSGPALIGHCIARSVVSKHIPGSLIAELDKVSSQSTSYHIRALSDALSESLSTSNLLAYCGFQAALQWSEADPGSDERNKLLSMVLDYIVNIPSLRVTQGLCGFLWHSLLEKEIIAFSENMKKRKITTDDATSSLLWGCRSVLSFLLVCSSKQGNLMDSIGTEKVKADVISIDSPQGMMFLPAIVSKFPSCDHELLRLCLQYLLLLEILLEAHVQINPFSYFPSMFRSAVMKGIFSCEGKLENVPKSLQMKRMKFVCGAVSAVLSGKQPSIRLSAMFSYHKEMYHGITDLHEFSDYTDLVLGLASMWELNIDDVRTHWVASLFAAGLDGNGKKVFHGIQDKTSSSIKLLPVAGHLLLNAINKKDKHLQIMLLSQSPPGVLEWMRKQTNHPTVTSLTKKEASYAVETALENLFNLIGPQLTMTVHEKAFQDVNNLLVLLMQHL